METYRLASRITTRAAKLPSDMLSTCSTSIVSLVVDMANGSVDLQEKICRNIRSSRTRALEMKKKLFLEDDSLDSDSELNALVSTQYGSGRLIRTRTDVHSVAASKESYQVLVNEIALDFGATLYQPVVDNVAQTAHKGTHNKGSAAVEGIAESGIPLDIPLEVNGECLYMSMCMCMCMCM
jgi:hypothetical protein